MSSKFGFYLIFGAQHRWSRLKSLGLQEVELRIIWYCFTANGRPWPSRNPQWPLCQSFLFFYFFFVAGQFLERHYLTQVISRALYTTRRIFEVRVSPSFNSWSAAGSWIYHGTCASLYSVKLITGSDSPGPMTGEQGQCAQASASLE